jgi:hypothetical protein
MLEMNGGPLPLSSTRPANTHHGPFGEITQNA